MTSFRVLLTGVFIVLATLFVATPHAAAATHSITIANFAFSPAGATIAAGDTVTWTNTDQAPHDVTVTSGPVAIHSPTIATGQSWTYTFTTPGTYSYICSIHPTMRATLVVAPAPAVVPTHPAVVPVPVTRARVAPPVARTSAVVAAPTTAVTSMPMPAAAPVAAAASGGQQTGLDPLLLVAGLVAGVATLCLLLIGSRPES
jgi:amicyanin